jgi:hypothetical protein
LGIGFGTIISVFIGIISTWIIITFIDLPPELINSQVTLFIRGLPYIEMQFLFILGGDPINFDDTTHLGILLNFDSFPYFNMIIWVSAGIVGGIFTQKITKGLAVGINTGIIMAILGWFLYWAILFGFDVNALMTANMLNLLNTYCVNGLKISIFATIGGLLGGAIGRQSS